MRPSLRLDFANTRRLDTRITISRASSGTYIDRLGLMRAAPANAARFDHDPITRVCKGVLIEEQRVNLLTNSSASTSWGLLYATKTIDAALSPMGVLNASTLSEDTSTNAHVDSSPGVLIAAGTTYTMSRFVKAKERTQAGIWVSSAGFGTATNDIFDLSSGAILTNGSGTAFIHRYAGGWFRIGCTRVATISETAYYQTRIAVNGSISYAGDGTSGIYVFGGQFEAGAFPTSYIPSTEVFTSRASAATFFGSNGLIQSAATDVARRNYNPLNLSIAPKLLTEAAATNLLTYSEQFDNAAWTTYTVNVTVDANVISSPDGTLTADKITKSAASFAARGQAVTAPTGVHTGSVFVKDGDLGKATLDLLDGTPTTIARGVYTFATNTFEPLIGLISDFSSVVLPGGWVRISATKAVTVANPQIRIYPGKVTEAIAGYIYTWGAQLEVGSFPTSYIPTTTAQVTRAADVYSSSQSTRVSDKLSMTGNNFSSWYNQDEGTFVIGFSRQTATPSAGYNNIFAASNGTSAEQICIYNAGATQTVDLAVTDNGSNTALTFSSGAIENNTQYKVAVGYKLNSVGYSKNGAIYTEDTAATLPTVDRLWIGANASGGGAWEGHISSLVYYPTRLSNSQLQVLTET